MATSLALVPRADVSAYAVPLWQRQMPEARRILLLTIANVLAVALAFGALHVIGSAIVTAPSEVPLTQAEAREAPERLMPPAPVLRPSAGRADAATMFALPVLVATAFAPVSQSAFTDRFVARSSPPASSPVMQEPVADVAAPQPRMFQPPPVAKLVSIAGVARKAIDRVDAVAAATPLNIRLDLASGNTRASAPRGGFDLGASSEHRVASTVASAVSSTVSVTTATVGGVVGSASRLLN